MSYCYIYRGQYKDGHVEFSIFVVVLFALWTFGDNTEYTS